MVTDPVVRAVLAGQKGAKGVRRSGIRTAKNKTKPNREKKLKVKKKTKTIIPTTIKRRGTARCDFTTNILTGGMNMCVAQL